MGKTNPLKNIIKRSIQLCAANLGPHTRSHRKPQLLILMYHRILPMDDERTKLEEPGMTVTPKTFQNNLETASKYFEFVRLSEWIENKNKGLPLPAKACAITFDDGWADNYEFAFPVLKKMRIPATIFLVANMSGTNKRFWPGRLAQICTAISIRCPEQWSNINLSWLRKANTDYKFSTRPPTREEISQLVIHAKNLPDHEIISHLNLIESELGLKEQPGNAALMNWSQIAEMTNSGLIEAGSHTCHHTRLGSEIPVETLEEEIIRSKEIIEKQTAQTVTTFCYPNGDYSDEALKLVEKYYSGAVTTESGWNSDKTSNYRLQRIGVHEDIAGDRTAFLARISGWI
ncbi:MAG TPA: chitin deacetylase [Gammaproteobacteria bacterium]|nr:chitin deacetylase [Gammaproteobacteria bacterium]